MDKLHIVGIAMGVAYVGWFGALVGWTNCRRRYHALINHPMEKRTTELLLDAELKNKRMERALHNITNMAHPQHDEIFREAMIGLDLKAEMEAMTNG